MCNIKYRISAITIFVCCCLFANNLPGQTKTIDSLIALVPTTKQDTSRAALFKKIAIQFFYKSDYKNAASYADSILQLSIRIGYKAGIGDGYNMLGTVQMKKDNYDSAFYYLSLALKTEQQNEDTAGQIACFVNLGYLFRVQGKYDSALHYFQNGLPLAEEIKDTAFLGKIHSGIAAIYHSQSNYAPALEHYLKTLQMAEHIGDNRQIGIATGNIGLLYSAMGQPRLSLEFHFRALALKTQTGNKDGASYTLENMGTVYEGMQQYDSAVYYYRQSLSLCDELGSKKLAATNLGHISHIFTLTGQPDSALLYNSKEYSIQKEIGNEEGMMYSRMNEGDIYLLFAKKDKSKASKAIRAFEQALSITEKIGKKSSMLLIYQSLAKAYAILNNHRTAFEYQVKYSDLHDSVKNEKFSRHITEMQTKYETEKKEN